MRQLKHGTLITQRERAGLAFYHHAHVPQYNKEGEGFNGASGMLMDLVIYHGLHR